MSIFVPVYRPKAAQQTFLDREQRRERKRKRDLASTGDSGSARDTSGSPEAFEARPAHPVSLLDPYYVAGHPRDLPLPGRNFPHAAAASERKEPASGLEAELAQVKPPIYAPKAGAENNSDFVRRRHIDNLTVILHTCMLRGDWDRASRVWGLLLRTEINGAAIDVRRHGRWPIGAELLMRRSHPQASDASTTDTLEPFATHHGFKLAREYYERLILQYPQRAAWQDSVNALAIYPALFNVWIFEVQERSKRERGLVQHGVGAELNSDSDPDSDSDSDAVGRTDVSKDEAAKQTCAIRYRELDQAQPILRRLEEMIFAPPFDTSPAILRYRGYVGAWVADIHSDLARLNSTFVVHNQSDDPNATYVAADSYSTAVKQHAKAATAEREGAKQAFRRMAVLGMDLPEHIERFVAEGEGSDVVEPTITESTRA